MRIEIERLTGWDQVFDSAMFTQRKESNGKTPSVNWKKKTCIAQHSVLRELTFSIKIYDVPNFVIQHLVRHTKVSPQPFVATQREDLTGIPSESVGRLTPNNLKFTLNAEALIFMAQQRLCFKASKETREVMEEIKRKLAIIEPELSNCLVSQCVYRNGCSEYKACNYFSKLGLNSGSIQERYDDYNKAFYGDDLYEC